MRGFKVSFVASLFFLLTVLGLLVPSAPALAASPSILNTQPTTITTTSKFTLPAGQCTALKTAVAQQKNDANMCVVVHTTKQIVTPTQKASAVTPARASGCFNGTVSFWDEYVEGGLLFSTQMNTTFYYYGNCSNPGLSFNGCYANYTRFGYSLGSLGCSDYTTGIPSHAALQTGWANEPAGLGGFRFWQRRECYVDYSRCNWAWG